MTFWAAVIFVGVAYKIYLAVSHIYFAHHVFDPTGVWTRSGSWFKRNVTIPATFGYKCAQNIWWATIPPRIQSLTIALFLFMNIFFNIHGYKIINESL